MSINWDRVVGHGKNIDPLAHLNPNKSKAKRFWILYRDYGYSELSIFGITERTQIAKEWRAAHADNVTVKCNPLDSLPKKYIV